MFRQSTSATRTSPWACTTGESLIATWRLATVHDRMADEYGIPLLQLLAHRGLPRRRCDGRGDRQRGAGADRRIPPRSAATI